MGLDSVSGKTAQLMSNPGITDAVDRTSLARFDMIIDVRSPGEFAEDRVPGEVLSRRNFAMTLLRKYKKPQEQQT